MKEKDWGTELIISPEGYHLNLVSGQDYRVIKFLASVTRDEIYIYDLSDPIDKVENPYCYKSLNWDFYGKLKLNS